MIAVFCTSSRSAVRRVAAARLISSIGSEAAFTARRKIEFPANEGTKKHGSMEIKLSWKQLTDRDDPFYQPGFEKKFNTLRQNILTMEEEAEAERPD